MYEAGYATKAGKKHEVLVKATARDERLNRLQNPAGSQTRILCGGSR
jgi:hypothetical protein